MQTVAVWTTIDFDKAPDYIVDVPDEVPLNVIIEPLVKFIKHPRQGLIESVVGNEVSPDQFRKMARQMFGDNAKSLTMADLQAIASKNKVSIPDSIRSDKTLRVGANWNLLDAPAAGAKADIHYVIMGKNSDGTVFEIPGIDDVQAKVNRMLKKELDAGAPVGASMEEQYEQLAQKVRLVAGGESEFVKSLLITGMPSAGKTFRVMKTIKELGLKEGSQYTVIGGKTTVAALYQVLVEQVNGLAIFDDCDSVVGDEDGINMLKKALDTDPVREVSYNAKRTLNTKTMPAEKRDRVVLAYSNILRGVATRSDVHVLMQVQGRTDEWEEVTPQDWCEGEDHTDPAVKKKWDDHHGITYEDYYKVSPADLASWQDWCENKMPNKIDFKGRIIFISNMREDEWDSAILTRCFHQNMEFSDKEMLDYIDTIKQYIHAPRLSEQDKQLVIDYVRELWEHGKISKAVNFRLIQQAFDLYLMNDWKSLVASIG